jgi:hypothetical protein
MAMERITLRDLTRSYTMVNMIRIMIAEGVRQEPVIYDDPDLLFRLEKADDILKEMEDIINGLDF